MRRKRARLSEQAAASVVAGCRKYERTMRQGLNPVRGDGDVQRQFDHFRAALERKASTNDCVRVVLCGHGVPPCRFVTYFNFALRVGKLLKMGLRDAVPIECNRWVATGLDPAVLRKICSGVFNVSVVDGPPRPGV